MTDHTLTLIDGQVDRGTYRPPHGRCSCREWSMIGPHDLIVSFHNQHTT